MADHKDLIERARELARIHLAKQDGTMNGAFGAETGNALSSLADALEAAQSRIEELEAELMRLRGALKEIANYKLSAPKRNFSGPNPWDELDATVPASEAEYMISVACEAIASTQGLKGEPK